MNKRTPVFTLVVLSLLLAVLSACAMGGIAAPDREIEISTDAALMAQSALVNGLFTGEVMLSESELSSYLTMAIDANSGAEQPIDSVVIWIEAEMLHFRVTLKDGSIMLPGGGQTLDLVGNLVVDSGMLQVDLMQAAAGGIMVGEMLMSPVSSQINAVLAAQMGAMLPAGTMISQETGSIMLSMMN